MGHRQLVHVLIISLVVTMTMQLECKQTKFTFIKSTDSFRDGTPFGQDGSIAYSTGHSVIVVSPNMEQLFEPIEYEPLFNHYCYRISSNEQGTLLIVVCFLYGSIPYFQGMKCNQQGCQKMGEFFEVINSESSYSKVEIVGNTLVYLSAQRDTNRQGDQVGKIIFYTIVMTEDSWKLQLTYETIDSYFFGSFTPIYINDFSIQKWIVNDKVIYKMILIDRANGLLWVDCELQNNVLVTGARGRLNLRPYLYPKSNTIFLGGQFFSKPVINGAKITTQVLVTTNNIDHYIVQLQFENDLDIPIFIKGVLKRHGNNDAMNRLNIMDNYASIAYTNYNRTTDICFYRLPQENSWDQMNLQIDEESFVTVHDQDYLTMNFIRDGDKLLFNYRTAPDQITQCLINKSVQNDLQQQQ